MTIKKPRVILNCKQCANKFGVIPALQKTAKFCSRSCKDKVFGISMIGNTINVGRVHTKEVKEANRQRNLGKTLSKEHKDKIRKTQLGEKNSMYGKQSWNKGKKCLYSTGENNNNWKGGITPYYRILRVARLKAAGGSHTKQEWERLLAQYNWTCPCCKKSDVKLTKDHIIPVVSGGSNNIQNIQPLCAPCNSRKNIKTIEYKLTETSYAI